MPASNNAQFGTDLRLLHDLDLTKSSRDPKSDLFLRIRPESGQRNLFDLDTVGGAENLGQAILLRLLTPVGDLAQLGHARYGTRLHELIGEPNNEINRNRAKLYVLQALADEPRIRKVLSVLVTKNSKEPTRMDIRASLLAVDGNAPLNLVFPFFLDRGALA